MRDTLFLYYVWGDRRSLAEPIGLGTEQAARRMLQDLIDLYHLPTNGKWYKGPRGAVL